MRGEVDAAEAVREYGAICRRRSAALKEAASSQLQRAARSAAPVPVPHLFHTSFYGGEARVVCCAARAPYSPGFLAICAAPALPLLQVHVSEGAGGGAGGRGRHLAAALVPARLAPEARAVAAAACARMVLVRAWDDPFSSFPFPTPHHDCRCHPAIATPPAETSPLAAAAALSTVPGSPRRPASVRPTFCLPTLHSTGGAMGGLGGYGWVAG